MQSVSVAVVIPVSGNRVWMTRRRGTGHLDSYWEFPGGKIRTDEEPPQAACREFLEETGIPILTTETHFLTRTLYDYPDRRVEIYFFTTRLAQEKMPESGEWVGIGQAQERKIPPANHAALDLLRLKIGKRSRAPG